MLSRSKSARSQDPESRSRKEMSSISNSSKRESRPFSSEFLHEDVALNMVWPQPYLGDAWKL